MKGNTYYIADGRKAAGLGRRIKETNSSSFHKATGKGYLSLSLCSDTTNFVGGRRPGRRNGQRTQTQRKTCVSLYLPVSIYVPRILTQSISWQPQVQYLSLSEFAGA